jgi:hypothetical protein
VECVSPKGKRLSAKMPRLVRPVGPSGEAASYEAWWAGARRVGAAGTDSGENSNGNLSLNFEGIWNLARFEKFYKEIIWNLDMRFFPKFF